MSPPANAPFPFFPDTTKHQPSVFPSPSPSNTPESGLGFDLDSFDHFSPPSFGYEGVDDPFDLSCGTTPSPASSGSIVSPKTSISLVTPATSVSPSFDFLLSDQGIAYPDLSNAEALSNHHLQRYLHYKALAAQAEAEAAVQSEEFDAFLDSISMPIDNNANPTLYKSDKMMAYQPQPAPQRYPSCGMQSLHSMQYQPPAQQSAAMHHAQAQAHMHAHDAALARGQPKPFNMYYQTSARPSLEGAQLPQPIWSRNSAPAHPIASGPFKSGPLLSNPASVAPVMTKASTSSSLPSFVTGYSVASASASDLAPSLPETADNEDELDDDDEANDGQASSGKKTTVSPLGVTNLNGGGRGYVPGKTLDDPKKRHKCQVCGRGFARAFNLKSHVQTHNPLRSKPHSCPHTSCQRGFSRLHDLERHRQGIHSDGPLVEAKNQGVPPAIARAQGRVSRRSRPGSL